MIQLTPNEKRVYEYIRTSISERALPPSVRDIKDALGFASTSTVHLYISRLEEKGLIKKETGKSRAISLVSASQPDAIQILVRFDPMKNIFTADNFEGSIDCYSIFKNSYRHKELFAFSVADNNLLDLGISQGDFLIACVNESISSGDLAIAFCDGTITVKSFSEEDFKINLSTSKQTILGRVIACIRIY